MDGVRCDNERTVCQSIMFVFCGNVKKVKKFNSQRR